MKRKLFVAAAALCIVAIMACGSLAYFTASNTATNKFMTATSYDPEDPEHDDPTDPDNVFSITVIEEVPTGAEAITDPTTGKQTGVLYKDIVPGASFSKKPVIKNTGAFGQYVRVKVVFDKYAAWKAALGSAADIFDALVPAANRETGFATNWTKKPVAVDTVADTATYIFYYKGTDGVLAPEATATLFNKVTIPSSLTTEQMLTVDGFTVTVKADAIQSENTGASAEATFTSTSPKYWTAD